MLTQTKLHPLDSYVVPHIGHSGQRVLVIYPDRESVPERDRGRAVIYWEYRRREATDVN